MTEAARIAHLEGQISDAKVRESRSQADVADLERRLNLLRAVVAAHPDADVLLAEWEIQVGFSP